MTSVYSIMEKHQVQLDGPTTWRQNEAQCPAFEGLLNLLRDACEHSVTIKGRFAIAPEIIHWFGPQIDLDQQVTPAKAMNLMKNLRGFQVPVGPVTTASFGQGR